MSANDSNQTGSRSAASNGTKASSPLNGDRTGEPSLTDLTPPDLPYAGFTWIEVGIILGVCVLLTAVLLASAMTGSPCCAPSSQAEVMREASSPLSYFFLWALSSVPIFWACVHLRPRNVGWGATLAGHLLLAFVVAFAVQLSYEGIQMGIVTLWPPSNSPDFTTNPVEVLTSLDFLNDLVPYVILLIIGFVREGYLRSQKRQERAERLEREAEQLRTQLTSARLDALRMQINPHFLHNTLHTISTMAGSDPDGIRRATARLSEMLRYALSTSDQQEAPLEKELDVLDSYLEIQKLRLGDRLVVSVDVDPEARRALVPTLLLQPIVENAVKHGFEGRDETGHLTIHARRDGNQLVLRVTDDGRGLSEEALDGLETNGTADEGLGLANVAERLHGLYGDAASLSFQTSDGGGLCVVIRLPFHTREPDQNLRASGVVAE